MEFVQEGLQSQIRGQKEYTPIIVGQGGIRWARDDGVDRVVSVLGRLCIAHPRRTGRQR